MFGERCARCFVKVDKVRLFDVIYEGKSDKLCERCAIIENISIIKRPGEEQIRQADMPPSVYDRMKKLSGIPEEIKQSTDSRANRLKELEENPGLMEPVKEKPDMLEHFNWTILRERRRRGLTQEKLAEAVNIPVEYIELLEKGNIPNNVRIIQKLENFFQIALMKKSSFTEEAIVHPVLLDEYGNVLDHIPEPEVEIRFSDDEYTDELIKKQEDEDFDIHKADLKKVSLKDLMDLHRKKILASKEEQKVEQRKIEDKEKLIEARKEELRLLRERQSKELDTLLGGSELLDSRKEEKINKIDQLFDKAFGE